MYTLLKNIAKVILPKQVLQKNEQLLRKLVASRYKGDTYQCNLCDFNLKEFVRLESGDLLCPNCGSNGRARNLWILLKKQLPGKRVLHFSPPTSLKTKIEKEGNTSQYFCSDYVGEFQTENQIDIQNINIARERFDLIICYHVLEHVKDDTAALRELHRVLAKNGLCYVQTPFKEGEIYEDPNIVTEEARLLHYGQKDHLRIYSVSGLEERMADAGWKVEVVRSQERAGNYFGLKKANTTLVGKK